MAQRILDFSREEAASFRDFITKNHNNIELIVSRLLLVLGFRPNLCGVKYLRDAIIHCFHRPKFSKVSFSGDIYPVIAKDFNANSRNIERDIRTAVQSCYYDGGMFRLNRICSYEAISEYYPPTISEFVMRSVEWLQTELDSLKE